MSGPTSQYRFGFSRVDLLVVIAIIAVLVGITLPAVQKARESAARGRGKDAMRQIVIACQSFESANGVIPDYVSPSGGEPIAYSCSTTFTKILPHIEFGALYGDAVKGGLLALDMKRIPLFINPSDPDAGQNGTWTSYAANGHIVRNENLTTAAGYPDGTSNTVFLSEKLIVCGTSGRWNSWAVNTPGIATSSRLTSEAATLDAFDPPEFTPGPGCNRSAASTGLANGIMAAMADGSVRVISRWRAGQASSAVGVTVWKAALTRDGGETFDAE